MIEASRSQALDEAGKIVKEFILTNWNRSASGIVAAHSYRSVFTMAHSDLEDLLDGGFIPV